MPPYCSTRTSSLSSLHRQEYIEILVYNIYTICMKHRRSTVSLILSVAFILLIAVGGAVFPILGLTVPLMIIAGGFSAFLTGRKRFCSYACPRGRVLGLFKPVSRYKPLPGRLRGAGFRRGLCGFMMLCSVMQIARMHPSLAGFSALGGFFWGMCMLMLSAAMIMALVYKPRSWCAVCPMGTLQNTVIPKNAGN